MEDSDGIVFENSESPSFSERKDSKDDESNYGKNDGKDRSSPSNQTKNVEGSSDSLSLTSFLRESQFLYIQMEFCEKSTLK